ncbi:hypothetical protein [Polaromonas sp. SM01]|uniref:hypothetical protein n=1 Tax=Polaromonas sp. SM01 TaxID=3085630 RepID=UPI0029814057|nr:hypothetical protein [Polaromonas sp. SM01]MDW5443270.1 hypothetical protein [Polaromonas sp. SM01]
MNILFAAIVLALVCLLIIWLLPSWSALSAQLGSYFSKTPAVETDSVPSQTATPRRSRKQSHADAPAHKQTGKRHTVVPHQARGR